MVQNSTPRAEGASSAPVRTLGALGLALALLVAGLGAAAVWHLRGVAVREAEADVGTLKDVLSDDMARVFGDLERVLRQSAEDVRAAAPRDAETLRARLLGRVEAGALVKGIRVEAGGRLESAGLPFLVPAELRAGSGGGLRIGVPFKNEAGRWRLVLGLPVEGGAAAALIDLEHMQGFFRDLRLPSGGAVSIFRDDGVRLIRWPHHEASTGQSFADISLFRTHLPQSPDRIYWDADTVFETARIFAYRRLAAAPIVVGISIRQEEALAGWRDQALIVGAASAALALAVLAIGVLAGQHLAQRRRLSHTLRRLAETCEAHAPPSPRSVKLKAPLS